MFTVQSRGVFTQGKSGYFSNGKVYREKWDREKEFTVKRCSLIRGVHYERFHCTYTMCDFRRYLLVKIELIFWKSEYQKRVEV